MEQAIANLTAAVQGLQASAADLQARVAALEGDPAKVQAAADDITAVKSLLDGIAPTAPTT